MRAHAVGFVMLLVVAGCGGAPPSEETAVPVTSEEASTSEPGASELSSPSERAPAIAGSHVGATGGVAIGVDLTGTKSDLVADTDALRKAVDGPPMTFVTARIGNQSDAAASLEAIEVTGDDGDVVVLDPATDLVRRLRSDVDLYDTDTFDEATQLLESVKGLESSAAPGQTIELLLGAEGRVRSITTVVAIGSFGELPLRER